MIPRSSDKYGLSFTAEINFEDRSELHRDYRFIGHPGKRINDRVALRDEIVHFPCKPALDPAHRPKFLLCRLIWCVFAQVTVLFGDSRLPESFILLSSRGLK